VTTREERELRLNQLFEAKASRCKRIAFAVDHFFHAIGSVVAILLGIV
jgi:hypothetical protein